MGCGDDTGDVVLDDQGDDVSHADTIRATDDLWRTTPADLAEWSMRASDMKAIARSLLAENQRLRDAVQAFIAAGSNPRTPEYAALVREVQALAGDAE